MRPVPMWGAGTWACWEHASPLNAPGPLVAGQTVSGLGCGSQSGASWKPCSQYSFLVVTVMSTGKSGQNQGRRGSALPQHQGSLTG